MAEEAGFTAEEADLIAQGNQGTDENPKTEPFLAGEKAREDYHFTTPERRKEMLEEALKQNDLEKFGQYLHAFQDSYSHQNSEVPETWARRILNLINPQQKNTPYPASTGHLVDGEWPDKTYNRPELADKMALETYNEIQNFYSITNSAKTINRWNEIKGEVMEFNRIHIENEDKKGQFLELNAK